MQMHILCCADAINDCTKKATARSAQAAMVLSRHSECKSLTLSPAVASLLLPALPWLLPHSTEPCSVRQPDSPCGMPRAIVPGSWSSFTSGFKSMTSGMSARGEELKTAPPQDQQNDVDTARDCMATAKELLLQVQDPQHEHHGWASLELIPLDEPCSPLYKRRGDAPPADPAGELREVMQWLTASMDGVDVDDLLRQPQQVRHASCLATIMNASNH